MAQSSALVVLEGEAEDWVEADVEGVEESDTHPACLSLLLLLLVEVACLRSFLSCLP